MKVAVSAVDAADVTTPVKRGPTPALRMILRGATAADHEIVDAAFERFDLRSKLSYTQFLLAHARALAPLERAVYGLWAPWTARYPLLQADLGDLGLSDSVGDVFVTSGQAEAWGALYVLEGSRLGGALLAKRVLPGLPVRYLSAVHEDGSWRRFGQALDLVGNAHGAEWTDAAIAGAKAAFARFANAAAQS